jgi:cyclic pyranopterin phosphate synthase
MGDSGPFYVFDEVDEGLSLLPTAAQRALELAGEELSLEGWQSLSQADRMALVTAGAIETIDPELVRSVVARALPASVAIEPKSDPDPQKPPANLLDALGQAKALTDQAKLTETRWASLRSLDRYALLSAVRGKPERLHQAYNEILDRELSHLNDTGEAHMVGVAAKPVTARKAIATARVRMRRETLVRIVKGDAPKGDVLAAARIAGIQAAKRTWELIPLCHPVALTAAEIHLTAEPTDGSEYGWVHVKATVEAIDRTGVEMEALVAASTAALTLYDMLKSIDRWMTISDLGLLEKSGGRSGHLRREKS